MFQKLFLVQFVVLICLQLSFSISLDDASAPTITEYKNEVTENGYFFKYNYSDGQQREERGELVTKNGKEFLVVSGFYSYIGTDGLEHFTEYTSDENGYRAETDVREPSVGIPGPVLASLAGGGLG